MSVDTFAKAVVAEGSQCSAGCRKPLHLHPVFTEMDIYGHGKPTRLVNVKDPENFKNINVKLPVSESICNKVCFLPWFKHYRPELIEMHAEAFRKVAQNHSHLLTQDDSAQQDAGGYSTSYKR